MIPVREAIASSSSAVAFFNDGATRLLRGKALSGSLQLGQRPTTATWSGLAHRLIVTGSAGDAFSLMRVKQDNLRLPEKWRCNMSPYRQPFSKMDVICSLWAEGTREVFDIANGREVFSVETPDDAGVTVETDQFIYAVGSRSGRALLFAKDDLRQGKNQALDVMLSSPETEVSPVTGYGRIAAAAEGNGVLAASGVDGMIYQYSEGMMAPAGSFSNYRRGALGVAVVDYSLRSVGHGHYQALVRSQDGGRYDLVLAGSSPKFSVCGSLMLHGTAAARPDAPEFMVKLADQPAGNRIRVRVSSSNGGSGTAPVMGLEDLTLLAFDKLTGWQRRAPMREISDGEYEASITVPEPARYVILVQSPQANLSFLEGNVGEVDLGGQP